MEGQGDDDGNQTKPRSARTWGRVFVLRANEDAAETATRAEPFQSYS